MENLNNPSSEGRNQGGTCQSPIFSSDQYQYTVTKQLPASVWLTTVSVKDHYLNKNEGVNYIYTIKYTVKPVLSSHRRD